MTKEEDKYSSIALLDEELEDEKWEERTAVITRNDHEEYIAAATSILHDLIGDVKTPQKLRRWEPQFLLLNLSETDQLVFCKLYFTTQTECRGWSVEYFTDVFISSRQFQSVRNVD